MMMSNQMARGLRRFGGGLEVVEEVDALRRGSDGSNGNRLYASI